MAALCAALGLTVAILAGCSTGGSGGSDLGSGTEPANNAALCNLIAQLPQSAAKVQNVDLRDPAAFAKAIDNAVKEYLSTLDQISSRVDSKLQPVVKQVRALVVAHKFVEAGNARVPLDTWTADHC